MKIPQSLKIAGKTYKVRWDDGRISDRGLVGEVDYSTCGVVLSKEYQGSKQTKESLEQVYLHELWHAIWDALGDTAMRKDERRADAFTGLLHQALNSGRGELKL